MGDMVILIKGPHLKAKSGAFFHKGIYNQYINRDRIKVNRLKMIYHTKLKLHAWNKNENNYLDPNSLGAKLAKGK